MRCARLDTLLVTKDARRVLTFQDAGWRQNMLPTSTRTWQTSSRPQTQAHRRTCSGAKFLTYQERAAMIKNYVDEDSLVCLLVSVLSTDDGVSRWAQQGVLTSSLDLSGVAPICISRSQSSETPCVSPVCNGTAPRDACHFDIRFLSFV